MEFEWDEAKRQRNMAKHGVDFVDVQTLFDGRAIVTTASNRFDEPRYVTTGKIGNHLFAVV